MTFASSEETGDTQGALSDLVLILGERMHQSSGWEWNFVIVPPHSQCQYFPLETLLLLFPFVSEPEIGSKVPRVSELGWSPTNLSDLSPEPVAPVCVRPQRPSAAGRKLIEAKAVLHLDSIALY